MSRNKCNRHVHNFYLKIMLNNYGRTEKMGEMQMYEHKDAI